MIDSMEKKGFVARSRDPKDRRKIHVQFTEKASTSWDHMVQDVERVNKIALKGLSDQGGLSLIRALNMLSDNLEQSRLFLRQFENLLNKKIKF